MKEQLNEIILSEIKTLNKLLELLDRQYRLILKKDVFGLDSIAEEIKLCNKEVAQQEVRRRALVKAKSMKELLLNYKDKELEKNYSDIVKLIHELELQKETNELLIRQSLSYTNQILNLLNPSKGAKTYNSYGKIER